MPTPQPSQILTNLQNWCKKWQNTKDIKGVKILHDDVFKEINNLKKHIKDGCLSDIPAGCGTNCNERMHAFLNKCGIAVNRIGPELAEALLAVHFHVWNE